MSTIIDVEHLLDPDHLAVEIANKWNSWVQLRREWVEQTKELRNYIYATDTKTTGNAILPWSNSTTTPKLTQISDNLHANYAATLFPQEDWIRWSGEDEDSVSWVRNLKIKSFMKTKIDQSGFVKTHYKLLRDYIHYGNAFSLIEWVDDFYLNEDGDFTQRYKGPILRRISPYDIAFNPAATEFSKTPKIIRSIHTIGEIAREAKKDSDSPIGKGLQKVLQGRKNVKNVESMLEKSEGFVADGFSNIQQYYDSDYVEVLTFYGDLYDQESGDVMQDRIITIMDRAYVVDNKEDPSWEGTPPIHHVGWRDRPDNLYAMGPLDNLVGLQYRIDHLENLKADVFDQIAYPIIKVKGDVEDFDFSPGSRIFIGEEGDVGYLQPDATALQADMQISQLEARMEELAGAPKQAMGIRTPGEKTAFEVQSLDNASGRIFQHKTSHYEAEFIEPQLNTMLTMSARKLTGTEVVRENHESGGFIFEEVSKEDLVGKGKVSPMAARHFAERARRVQNLTQLWQIAAADPSVKAHLSGKELARIMAFELGEESLFAPNIAVKEQSETQVAVEEEEVTNQDSMAEMAAQGE